MIKKVLIGFAIAIVVILFLLWLATGGPRDVANYARGMVTPLEGGFWQNLTGGASGFRLPWQPELTMGPDISELFPDGSAGDEEAPASQQDLSDAEREYEELMKKVNEAKTFGEPSPYRGQVNLSQGNATESSPNTEYVAIEASFGNTAPVPMSGWSLQSALTGVRGHIPRGAEGFILGAVNAQRDVYLAPGASAIVTSGPSPVGTSFRENMCTGYLGSLQTFTPSLSRNCPSPSESLPLTPENLQAYGDACYDFVQTVPPCILPKTPADISPSCHIFLSNNLSYNGCVANYQHKSNFEGSSWRIYLNAHGELWRNTHDIIRLLDAEGRTVDMVSY